MPSPTEHGFAEARSCLLAQSPSLARKDQALQSCVRATSYRVAQNRWQASSTSSMPFQTQQYWSSGEWETSETMELLDARNLALPTKLSNVLVTANSEVASHAQNPTQKQQVSDTRVTVMKGTNLHVQGQELQEPTPIMCMILTVAKFQCMRDPTLTGQISNMHVIAESARPLHE